MKKPYITPMTTAVATGLNILLAASPLPHNEPGDAGDYAKENIDPTPDAGQGLWDEDEE